MTQVAQQTRKTVCVGHNLVHASQGFHTRMGIDSVSKVWRFLNSTRWAHFRNQIISSIKKDREIKGFRGGKERRKKERKKEKAVIHKWYDHLKLGRWRNFWTWEWKAVGSILSHLRQCIIFILAVCNLLLFISWYSSNGTVFGLTTVLQLKELEILIKLMIYYIKYGKTGRTPFCFSRPELMAGVVCVRSIELTFQVLC